MGFRNQMIHLSLDNGIGSHLRSAIESVFNRPAGYLAGLDDVVCSGSVVRLGVTYDVNDVRLERHLDVDADCQVSTRCSRFHWVAEQTGAGLPPDMETLILPKVRSFLALPAF